MILLDKGFLSWSDYRNLFNVLKDGGMIRVGKHAFVFKKGDKGYHEVSVYVCGEDVDEKVMFIGKKEETKKKVKEPLQKPKGKVGGLFDMVD